MSCSGKTTLSNEFSKIIKEKGFTVKIIDGDTIRNQKNYKLDFSVESIKINNRKIIKICENLSKDFNFILVAVIMPFQEMRDEARRILGSSYYEVFIKTKMDTLIKRDTKGYYKKALNGEIQNFIGIDKNTPFETPKYPDIIINTNTTSISDSCKLLVNRFLI